MNLNACMQRLRRASVWVYFAFQCWYLDVSADDTAYARHPLPPTNCFGFLYNEYDCQGQCQSIENCVKYRAYDWRERLNGIYNCYECKIAGWFVALMVAIPASIIVLILILCCAIPQCWLSRCWRKRKSSQEGSLVDDTAAGAKKAETTEGDSDRPKKKKRFFSSKHEPRPAYFISGGKRYVLDESEKNRRGIERGQEFFRAHDRRGRSAPPDHRKRLEQSPPRKYVCDEPRHVVVDENFRLRQEFRSRSPTEARRQICDGGQGHHQQTEQRSLPLAAPQAQEFRTQHVAVQQSVPAVQYQPLVAQQQPVYYYQQAPQPAYNIMMAVPQQQQQQQFSNVLLVQSPN